MGGMLPLHPDFSIVDDGIDREMYHYVYYFKIFYPDNIIPSQVKFVHKIDLIHFFASISTKDSVIKMSHYMDNRDNIPYPTVTSQQIDLYDFIFNHKKFI